MSSMKKCESCGKNFEANENNYVCSECSPQITNERSDKYRPGKLERYLILSLFIGLVICFMYFVSVTSELKDEVRVLEAETEELKGNVQDSISVMRKIDGEANNEELKRDIKYLEGENFFYHVNYFSNDGDVTDIFVVNKSGLFNNGDSIGGFIDLRMQPQSSPSYVGQGEFNYSDRELRKYLKGMMNQIEETYNFVRESHIAGKQMPTWDNVNIRITVQNYNVATFTDGKITLYGEKVE